MKMYQIKVKFNFKKPTHTHKNYITYILWDKWHKTNCLNACAFIQNSSNNKKSKKKVEKKGENNKKEKLLLF